jgi:hypothetical protein
MDTRVHMQEVQQITHLVDLVVENFKYSQLCFWIRSLNLFHQITNQCTYISGSQLQNSTALGEFNKKDSSIEYEYLALELMNDITNSALLG